MARRLGRGVLLTAVLAVAACGDDSAGVDAGGGAGVDAGTPDAGADAAPAGDNNDSFDEAVPVDVDGPGRPGGIEVPGDQDFYTFDGVAGQWLELIAMPDDFSSDLLPIVTLFDESKTQVGEGFVLTTRLTATGTYYAKVEDMSSLYGDPMPIGGPELTYTLGIIEPVDGVDDNYFDTETGDDAASARPVPASGFFFADLLGSYDHAGDRDVFSFSVTGSTTKSMFTYVDPPGPMGSGSTSDYGELWITDATGTEILARVDSSSFGFLRPPLPSPRTYLLWIDRDTTPAGENDFYVASAFGGGEDDPPENETLAMPGTNDSIALADANGETITLVGSPPEAYFISYLPPGDVDYIAFDVSGAVTIEAHCFAKDYGSGLVGTTGEIRDSSDTVIVGATEPAFVSLDTTLPAAGRYYFRLSASGQDPEVTGNWVRCRISIPSF